MHSCSSNPEPIHDVQEALGRLPYLVALDAEQRAVVLAVRGTSSLSDALTDAIAQPCGLLAGWLGRAAQARSSRVACRVMWPPCR